MYPSRYRLQELTAHVVAALERRREGVTDWNADAEAKLTEEARTVLAEAGKQFAEVADDKAYWERTERTILSVALPRYFVLAKEEHAAAKDKYGIWRGGDLVSRVAYAIGGLVTSALVVRFGKIVWLDVAPIAFFIGGPLLPDVQIWNAKRKYRNKLGALVEDMREEAEARDQYRPMMEGAPAAIDDRPTEQAKAPPDVQKTKES